MSLAKRYDPHEAEPRLARFWEEIGVSHFQPGAEPVYSIDTPPPTVSGHLHLGSVYSYCQPDFIARFRRMRGENVYYPMGYDDNGLPTERLVERELGQTAEEMGREAFIRACLELAPRFEAEYEALWRRLGLSIDWRYMYRTIDESARRISQRTFLELYRRGLTYRRQAPTIWCPTCKTAIAQAEESDLTRSSELVTFTFTLDDGSPLPIASTRPELLPACVAVFVHPADARYRDVVGRRARVPLFAQDVPVLTDVHANPEKGTGAVMCCTFGDTQDVEWWYTHGLPLREAIGRSGEMLPIAGQFAGQSSAQARAEIIKVLAEAGALIDRTPIEQSVRVHERCDTPVEYIVAQQWFVRVLDHKAELIAAGAEIDWHPPGMETRYRDWIENLNWDWCISRQRYYGVPFPVWYCDCGEVLMAREDQLPVDPTVQAPPQPCACGSTSWRPETDVMDTWATSACSPQIAGRWLDDPALYAQVFPMSLRPQGHDIIRTWIFGTMVMALYRPTGVQRSTFNVQRVPFRADSEPGQDVAGAHGRDMEGLGEVPWGDVLISGWGVAPGGAQKISKSRGGGPMAPMAMLERYSADAARYWAASAGPGKDAVISEEKIAAGAKLVNKLWNVARLAERFTQVQGSRFKVQSTEIVPRVDKPHRVLAQAGESEATPGSTSTSDSTHASLPPESLSTADAWVLSRVQGVVRQVTDAFLLYEYAAAKSVVEDFFWSELCDNYLEMAKKRLYDAGMPGHEGARFALSSVLLTTLKLFAPFLPYVTEEMYQGLFRSEGTVGDHVSIHRLPWPEPDESLVDPAAEAAGAVLVGIATAVRRYKSEHGLSLGVELQQVHIVPPAGVDVLDASMYQALQRGVEDIASVTRARAVTLGQETTGEMEQLEAVPGPAPFTVYLSP